MNKSTVSRIVRAILLSLALAFSFSGPFSSTRASAALRPYTKPFKVVIDAGHGGSDHGTVYDNGLIQIAEKDVTLMIARQVVAELRSRGFVVAMTRHDDRELPLGARTQLANRMGADIFLSIHMNSTHTPLSMGADGVETYILNNATDASSRRLAHLENTVISHEGIETPEQADVALILRDLRLDANLSESKRLACSIQGNLANAPGVRRHNRGVKQALFHVLLGADMPSVLVEAGFLSSPRDRAIVLSPQGRRSMSAAIVRALDQYRSLKGTPYAASALSRCKVN
jgi:N-acetylmuramoyl-L-alanine amidase